jgi:uncharacterized membrane protein YdbT with pleckstrin-like domain
VPELEAQFPPPSSARVSQAASETSYISKIIQPNERIKGIGRLHWIIYAEAAIALALSIACFCLDWRVAEAPEAPLPVGKIAGTVLLISSVCMFFRAWFDRLITEIAVTNQRVIYKHGFIRRRTAEMNMDKVESVEVTQSIFGRLFGYGSLHILGTGRGIERLDRIANPVSLRNHIVAR